MDEQQGAIGAYTRVLLDRVGRGSRARAIRRAFLFDRHTGRFLELQVVYLDLEFGLKSLNAQKAVLADLTFLILWIEYRKRKEPGWVAPEQRAACNQLPLTQREIKDFGRWCQRNSSSLANEAEHAKSTVRQFPGTDVVKVAFRNRRLRNASLYVQWLVSMLAVVDERDEGATALIDARRRTIGKWFDKELLPDPKGMPIRSLHPTQAKALQGALREDTVFPATPIGKRDKAIFELLRQGLRAGELLKLRCGDLDDAYQVDLGRKIAVVSVVRRPNDLDDERLDEPSVKTRPATVPVPRRVAQALLEYTIDVRRLAVDARSDGKETPYLFVNQQGKHIGRPLSQRNLNRIVAKLKGQFGLPDNLHPHAMRHTHLTELFDQAKAKGLSNADIRVLLIDRGRWAPNSTMPALYTARSLMRESAEYVEERDRELAGG